MLSGPVIRINVTNTQLNMCNEILCNTNFCNTYPILLTKLESIFNSYFWAYSPNQVCRRLYKKYSFHLRVELDRILIQISTCTFVIICSFVIDRNDNTGISKSNAKSIVEMVSVPSRLFLFHRLVKLGWLYLIQSGYLNYLDHIMLRISLRWWWFDSFKTSIAARII